MNEFQSLPEEPESQQPIASASSVQKNWLMRPRFLGQSLLMLAVYTLIILLGGGMHLNPTVPIQM